MINKRIMKILDEKIEEIVRSLYHQETKDLVRMKTFFAGGAIRDLMRGRTPKDFDLFFVDEESTEKFKELARKEFSLKQTIIGNYNQKQTQAQLITIVSGSPTEVVEKFDFTINQGYYVPQMKILVLGEKDNILEVCSNVTTPVQALLRVEKFRKSGYDVPMKVFVELGVAISKMEPIDTEQKLEDALKGISYSEILEGVEDDIDLSRINRY